MNKCSVLCVAALDVEKARNAIFRGQEGSLRISIPRCFPELTNSTSTFLPKLFHRVVQQLDCCGELLRCSLQLIPYSFSSLTDCFRNDIRNSFHCTFLVQIEYQKG